MWCGLPGHPFVNPLEIPGHWTNSDTEYYRQTPPKVPNFCNTLFRRNPYCGGIVGVSASDKTIGKSTRTTITNDKSRVFKEEIECLVSEANQ
jgi:hypothetical protein